MQGGLNSFMQVLRNVKLRSLDRSGFVPVRLINFKTNILEMKGPCFHRMLSNAVPNKYITKYSSNIKIYCWEATWCNHSGCVATQSQTEDKLRTGVNFGCLATVAKTDVRNRQPIDRHGKTKAMTSSSALRWVKKPQQPTAATPPPSGQVRNCRSHTMGVWNFVQVRCNINPLHT